MSLRLDAHVHTRHSYDATPTVREVLSSAREADVDGVVVTDHDTVAGSRRAVDLAPEYGLFALPGVEVSTAGGHLLALGVAEAPARGRPMSGTVAAVRERGGVAVVPHPFQVSRHGAGRRTVERAAPDALETFNAHLLTGVQNRRTARFADRAGYPAIAGSDAHRSDMVGRAYTTVHLDGAGDRSTGPLPDPAAVDPERVLDALREGRTSVQGRRTPARRYVGKLAHNATIRTGGGLARVRGLLPR